MRRVLLTALGLALIWAGRVAPARAGSDYDELKVDRQTEFQFAAKPTIAVDGDNVTIRFAVTSACDVAVAIQDGNGRIIRHLASGVLGENAPSPFQKGSLSQTLVWDGKNDQGVYVKRGGLSVRVSLGLQPHYERNLLWSPAKRIGTQAPLMAAAPEGVYVFDALGVDHVRLFDHDGNYVRTVYPFPNAKLDDVKGMQLHTYPHDGAKLPVKHGFVQASLLQCGTSYNDGVEKAHGGIAATTMAVRGNRIALAYVSLGRLGADGGSAGLPLLGPKVGMSKRIREVEEPVGPTSAAFSPDGKYVYLTGYHWNLAYPRNAGSWHGVYRVAYDSDEPPTVFAGEMTEAGNGEDAAHFSVPTSVAVDAKGRVYVSDFMNDRVQIFDASGKLLKSLPTSKPARVLVHQKSGEIYVFSWPAKGLSNKVISEDKKQFDFRKFDNKITRYGPFENPKQLGQWDLPTDRVRGGGMVSFGTLLSVEIDSWADKPTLWLAPSKHKVTAFEVSYWGGGTIAGEATDQWAGDGVQTYTLEDNQWKLGRNFSDEVREQFTRAKPPDFGRQRLYFNPRDRKLYVAEDSSFGKSFKDMLQVDPQTGRVKRVDLPFDAEDMCFDQNGLAYLRTDREVVRYDPVTWREVPWDYGEERRKIQFSSIGGGKPGDAIAALATPGSRPVCWHQGGMWISPKGHLVISCTSRDKATERQVGVKFRVGEIEAKVYTPTLYPGRVRHGEIHVWDRHGQLVYEDAVPGLTWLCGVGIDNEDSIYVLADSTRAFDGEKYFNEMTGTVMKFRPKKGRVVSASPRATIKLGDVPQRPAELNGGMTGKAWVENAEWLFGAAGWFGFNTARAGGGCDCWHSRFTIDYYARSFVPEVERYSVAVLDSAGNVILRMGRPGNVDDGMPLDREAAPPNARSIGGDEIALFHAAYVGVDTDNRLFIHDVGNGRIMSVKLDYKASEIVPMSEGQ